LWPRRGNEFANQLAVMKIVGRYDDASNGGSAAFSFRGIGRSP